jgi:hypothetical protein
MKTFGPAASFATSAADLPQNEQDSFFVNMIAPRY